MVLCIVSQERRCSLVLYPCRIWQRCDMLGYMLFRDHRRLLLLSHWRRIVMSIYHLKWSRFCRWVIIWFEVDFNWENIVQILMHLWILVLLSLLEVDQHPIRTKRQLHVHSNDRQLSFFISYLRNLFSTHLRLLFRKITRNQASLHILSNIELRE